MLWNNGTLADKKKKTTHITADVQKTSFHLENPCLFGSRLFLLVFITSGWCHRNSVHTCTLHWHNRERTFVYSMTACLLWFCKHRWYQFIRVLIQSEQTGLGRCSWACWHNGWHCHTKHIRPQLVPTNCSKLNRESVRFSELSALRIFIKKFSKRHWRVSWIQPRVFKTPMTALSLILHFSLFFFPASEVVTRYNQLA